MASHHHGAAHVPGSNNNTTFAAAEKEVEADSTESGPRNDVLRDADGGVDGRRKADGDALQEAERPQQATAAHVASIPNGGVRAWLQVVGAFFLFFNSWGIVNTFGSYETYYETDLLRSSSPSSIAWIGSVQAFLLLIVGALAGPLYDAGYFRHLLAVGSLLLVLGQMMLSLCTEYWQVMLAQAVCVGIGCGIMFVPSVAILSTYFTTKIATAIGLAASGSSLGMLLSVTLPPPADC